MIKKYIAMGLVFVVSFSSAVPSYAQEREKKSSIDIEQFISGSNVSKETEEEILEEINTIEEHYLNDAEYLTNIFFGEEDLIYTFVIPSESGEITTDIQVEKNKNGDIEFYITEGDIYNELTFTADNHMILDGNEVAAESKHISYADTMNMRNEIVVQPNALGSVYFDEDPFWGKEKDYNDYNGKTKHNVIFDGAIQTLAASTISAMIGFLVPGAGTILSLLTLAQGIKSAYDAYDLHGSTLYYTLESWDNPKAPSIEETMTSYCKIRLKWFTDSKYKNEVIESEETYYNKTVIRDV